MSFFRQPLDEAEKHHRKALRRRDYKRKEFDLGLSIWHFKQAIQLRPNNPVFHYHLGRTYAGAPLLAVLHEIDAGFRLSDSAELAIAELKEAIRLKPNYPKAFMVLGKAYLYLGEQEKALKAFHAVQELSDSKMLLSSVEQEIQQAEQGINEHPQPTEAMRHLEQAVIYRSQGKYRKAVKELGKALKLAPNWHWLYYNLCKVGS